MPYSVVENNLCNLDALYRKLGKDFILNRHFMVGEEVDMTSFRVTKALERLLGVDECLLDFNKETIIELINKQIHVKL